MIAGYAYTNFQEMCQRAVKVARIIDETKIENKERGPTKREIGPGKPKSQGRRNFKRSKSTIKQDKGKQAV